MKLIINTSNLVIGGGIQVALSVLSELKNYYENEYHIFISSEVEKQLEIESFDSNFHFYSTPISPSGLKTRKKVNKKLDNLEYEIQPDVVFTIFGPSYWKPKSVHVQGFADGWCYNPDSIAFNILSIKERIKTRLLNFYKNYYIKKHSDFLIVETNVAKRNIVNYLKIRNSDIFVVGNTYGSHFDNYGEVITVPKPAVFNLITISAFYKHKNLTIINEVIKVLKEKSAIQFKFHLTIDEEKFKHEFGSNPNVTNYGPISNEQCPLKYAECDALFLPTLLETFTASYPEAMKMNKPILTSDLDFAKDICKNAAIYFDPMSAEAIADKILLLSEDKNLYLQLVKKGKIRLKSFETASSRTKKYLGICKELSKKSNLLV